MYGNSQMKAIAEKHLTTALMSLTSYLPLGVALYIF
jgi:hypothetical protein